MNSSLADSLRVGYAAVVPSGEWEEGLLTGTTKMYLMFMKQSVTNSAQSARTASSVEKTYEKLADICGYFIIKTTITLITTRRIGRYCVNDAIRSNTGAGWPLKVQRLSRKRVQLSSWKRLAPQNAGDDIVCSTQECVAVRKDGKGSNEPLRTLRCMVAGRDHRGSLNITMPSVRGIPAYITLKWDGCTKFYGINNLGSRLDLSFIGQTRS